MARILTCVLVVFLLTALVACGDDNATTDTPSEPAGGFPSTLDTCELLSTEEVREATGIVGAVTRNRDRPDGERFECYWVDPVSDFNNVNVALVRKMTSSTPSFSGAEVEELAEQGIVASYLDIEGIPILEVFADDWYIMVSPISVDLARSGDSRANSIRLAELVVSRLDP